MKNEQIKELKRGLEKVTGTLNGERNLWNKYIEGQEYFFEEDEQRVNSKFKITIRYRRKGTGICAEVVISDRHLGGMICSMKSAKPVADFLHSFSHKYCIPLRTLASALKSNYFE